MENSFECIFCKRKSDKTDILKLYLFFLGDKKQYAKVCEMCAKKFTPLNMNEENKCSDAFPSTSKKYLDISRDGESSVKYSDCDKGNNELIIATSSDDEHRYFKEDISKDNESAIKHSDDDKDINEFTIKDEKTFEFPNVDEDKKLNSSDRLDENNINIANTFDRIPYKMQKSSVGEICHELNSGSNNLNKQELFQNVDKSSFCDMCRKKM